MDLVITLLWVVGQNPIFLHFWVTPTLNRPLDRYKKNQWSWSPLTYIPGQLWFKVGVTRSNIVWVGQKRIAPDCYKKHVSVAPQLSVLLPELYQHCRYIYYHPIFSVYGKLTFFTLGINSFGTLLSVRICYFSFDHSTAENSQKHKYFCCFLILSLLGWVIGYGWISIYGSWK